MRTDDALFPNLLGILHGSKHFLISVRCPCFARYDFEYALPRVATTPSEYNNHAWYTRHSSFSRPQQGPQMGARGNIDDILYRLGHGPTYFSMLYGDEDCDNFRREPPARSPI
ncbi:hypothetical protein RJ55_03237 [Drechmeria coniospora]|nr:hypothetical protein RJ55_03237 [Drechmeria coniospora]